MLKEEKTDTTKRVYDEILLEKLLNSKKTSDRESAVRQLGEIGGEKAIKSLAKVVLADSNDNLRKFGVEQLDKIGPPLATPVLLQCLQDEAKQFIKHAAIIALGHSGNISIIEPIKAILINNPKTNIGLACIDSLVSLPFPDVAPTLATIVKVDLDPTLKAYLIKKIGELGDGKQAILVEDYINKNHDEKVRLATLTALNKLAPLVFVRRVATFAENDASTKVRKRIAALLSNGQGDAIELLFRLLCFDSNMTVKQTSQTSLAKITQWELKLEKLIHVLEQEKPRVSSLDTDMMVLALTGFDLDNKQLRDQLLEKLILVAIASDKILVPVYAALVVSAADRSQSKAGQYIEQVQIKHQLDYKDMEQLRVEVGGAHALSPLFNRLEEDLKVFFQEPIQDLNRETKIEWKKTIQTARIGFLVRMSMSCIVFIAGMLLLAIASYQFLFNQLSGNQLWGAGVSFVSGISAMLLVIYTGPLKDIRRAVSDMGSTNAAFIAYIHRILQISHTFSAKYLAQSISFDDTEHSCKLISEAMLDTVSKLEFTSNQILEKTKKEQQKASDVSDGG